MTAHEYSLTVGDRSGSTCALNKPSRGRATQSGLRPQDPNTPRSSSVRGGYCCRGARGASTPPSPPLNPIRRSPASHSRSEAQFRAQVFNVNVQALCHLKHEQATPVRKARSTGARTAQHAASQPTCTRMRVPTQVRLLFMSRAGPRINTHTHAALREPSVRCWRPSSRPVSWDVDHAPGDDIRRFVRAAFAQIRTSATLARRVAAVETTHALWTIAQLTFAAVRMKPIAVPYARPAAQLVIGHGQRPPATSPLAPLKTRGPFPVLLLRPWIRGDCQCGWTLGTDE